MFCAFNLCRDIIRENKLSSCKLLIANNHGDQVVKLCWAFTAVATWAKILETDHLQQISIFVKPSLLIHRFDFPWLIQSNGKRHYILNIQIVSQRPILVQTRWRPVLETMFVNVSVGRVQTESGCSCLITTSLQCRRLLRLEGTNLTARLNLLCICYMYCRIDNKAALNLELVIATLYSLIICLQNAEIRTITTMRKHLPVFSLLINISVYSAIRSVTKNKQRSF